MWSIAIALLLTPLLTLVTAPVALAGDITVGYDPIGIWPQFASANSKRYFRAVVEYDPDDDYPVFVLPAAQAVNTDCPSTSITMSQAGMRLFSTSPATV